MKKKIISSFILIGFLSCMSSTVWANNEDYNIGELKIRKNIEKKEKRYFSDEDQYNIGQIKLIKKNVYKVLIENNRKNPSEEALKILNILDKIVSFQNKGDFASALENMKILAQNYQEFPTFQKWVGIYQNELHEYSNSLETFNQTRNLFPFNQSGYDMDVRYYEIDNLIHLKRYKEAQVKIKQYEENIDNENKNKELLLFLSNYQKFLIETKETGIINKEKLDTLWSKIPKDKERNLNAEKGVNLDELGYIYGKFYNRKDVLKKYVERNEKFRDDETIQNVISAKETIFSKY